MSIVPSISASVKDEMLQIVFFLLDHQICFALFLEHVATVSFLQIDETATDH